MRAWSAALIALAACAQAPDAGPADAGTIAPPPVPWLATATATLDDEGLSQEIEIPYPASVRYVAIRVVPPRPTPPGLCYRLEPVTLASGSVLVEGPDEQGRGDVTDHGPEHLRWGEGGAVFVFSTTATPLMGPDTLRVRVAVRDCVLGVRAGRARFPQLPAKVQLDVAHEPAPGDLARGRLAIRIARTQGVVLDPATLATIERVASDRFAEASIELTFESDVSLASDGLVTVRPGAPEALEALETQAIASWKPGGDRRFVPVVFASCVREEDPATGVTRFPHGRVTRVPGSLGEGTSPSLVVLAAGSCDADAPPAPPSWSPEERGLIFAHELGHYLGLFHSDQAPGRELAGDGGALMQSNAGAVDPARAHFSNGQIQVLRRHPDVVFEAASP